MQPRNIFIFDIDDNIQNIEYHIRTTIKNCKNLYDPSSLLNGMLICSASDQLQYLLELVHCQNKRQLNEYRSCQSDRIQKCNHRFFCWIKIILRQCCPKTKLCQSENSLYEKKSIELYDQRLFHFQAAYVPIHVVYCENQINCEADNVKDTDVLSVFNYCTICDHLLN